MGETRRGRLIDVAFPLEEVSAHSRREKNVRYGHISTLHIWWARRPLPQGQVLCKVGSLRKEYTRLLTWTEIHHLNRTVNLIP